MNVGQILAYRCLIWGQNFGLIQFGQGFRKLFLFSKQ